MAEKIYTTVAVFPSKSDPSKSYSVKQDQFGELSCDCRGWTIKKPGKPRTCTHVQKVEANQPAPAPLPAPEPVLVGSKVQETGGSLGDLLKSLEEKGL